MILKIKIVSFLFVVLSVSGNAQMKYFLFDIDGKPVMPGGIVIFDKLETKYEISGIYNGGEYPEFRYACVCKDKKWGVIDTWGKIQIPLIYQRVAFWDPYRTSAVMQDGKWGFINSKGELVIPHKYPVLARSRDNRNRCSVENESGLWGVLDITTGEEIFPCKYNEIGSM